MQNEITQLKQKVKSLERQLCDRTRNYLYHFKKSPIKKTNNLIDTQVQTEMASFLQEGTQNNSLQQCYFDNININVCNHNQSKPQQRQVQRIQQKTNSNFVTNSQNSKIQHQSNLFAPIILISDQTHQNEIKSLTQQIENMKNQLQSTKTPQNIIEGKVQFLNIPSQCKTPKKDSEVNQFSKKKQIETIDELSESKFNGESSVVSSIQQDHHVKQIKILKKQIKKLKNHLQTELLISSQTKQALLISEQENYKFRLQIQKLNKEIQILTGAFSDSDNENPKPFSFQDDEPAFKSVDSDHSESTKQELEKYKNQSEKYEEHISILQGIKRDYLKRCIEAKEEICRLKQENQHLKTQNCQLRVLVRRKQQTSGPQPKNELFSEKIWSQWGQILISKIHEISNCLPLIDNHEQYLFKPDSLEDMVSMLERILKFCKNIEMWEKERIQSIEKERSNLLKIVSSVLMKHPESKQTIAEEILEIQELKYLVNFMNKQPKSALRSRQNLSLKVILGQANQSNPVTTN